MPEYCRAARVRRADRRALCLAPGTADNRRLPWRLPAQSEVPAIRWLDARRASHIPLGKVLQEIPLNDLVLWLDQLRMSDLGRVGGKNASLG